MFVTWGDPGEPGHHQELVGSLDEQRHLLRRLEEQARASAGGLVDVMLSPRDRPPGPALLFQVGADKAVVIWISPAGASFTSKHAPGDEPPLPDLYSRGRRVPYAPSKDLVSRSCAAADEFYTTGGTQPSRITWRPG